MSEDPAEHPSVKIFGLILLGVILAVMVMLLWISNVQEQRDAWAVVPVGARCGTLGAEERTYDRSAVFCVPFPHYGIQVWSWSDADVQTPVPTPVDARDAQIRMCMHRAGLDHRNCQAAIEQYEQAR